MAEKKVAENVEAPVEKTQAPNKSQSMLLYGLLVVNMLVVLAVGLVVFMQKEEPSSLEKIAAGIETEEAKEGSDLDRLIGNMVPLEVFLVNLSGTDGSRLLKVALELEVNGEDVQEEIEKRKPQIRDIIIILLSSRSYAEISTQSGKDQLRDEIKDTLNSFLTRGSVQRVLYTEFIFN